MGILSRFFRRKTTRKVMAEASPFSIPRPDGWPSGGRIHPPKKRGKTAEQYEREYDEYVARVEGKKREIAAFNRAQAVKAGISEYVWKSSKTAQCDICSRRNGKVYSYNKPTKDGYPGEGTCGNRALFCHARASPVVDHR